MTPLPRKPTGADLHDAIMRAAGAAGRSPNDLCLEITKWPQKYLEQLVATKNPKAVTITRVQALIEGRPVPPRKRPAPPNRRRVPDPEPIITTSLAEGAAPVAQPAPLRREPCPWCATRADMHAAFGCERPWE